MEFYRELYDGDHQRRPVTPRAEPGRYRLQRKIVYVAGHDERDHGRMVEFVRRGDTDGAVGWLQGHLERMCERLVGLMQEDEQDPS